MVNKMHGHALSGSRKLNRHWQSGSRKAGLQENLVFFEREITETEWPISDTPYHTISRYGSSIYNYYTYMSHSAYNLRRPPVRNKMGFQDFIILQPGDYQLHWNLKTHRYETFTRDGENFGRIISGDCDANYGIMAAIMYPQAQPLGVAMSSAPYYKETDSSGCIYYAGRAADFVTPYYDRPAFQENVQFINEHIIQYVVPYRSTTLNVGWLTITGANSFFLTDGQEENTLIFHIGDKAPFPQFQFQAQNNEAWFRKTGDYFSPAIYIYATQNLGLNDVAIVTGKIWLERIGDYTDNQDGWEKEILSVPSGWIIR